MIVEDVVVEDVVVDVDVVVEDEETVAAGGTRGIYQSCVRPALLLDVWSKGPRSKPRKLDLTRD